MLKRDRTTHCQLRQCNHHDEACRRPEQRCSVLRYWQWSLWMTVSEIKHLLICRWISSGVRWGKCGFRCWLLFFPSSAGNIARKLDSCPDLSQLWFQQNTVRKEQFFSRLILHSYSIFQRQSAGYDFNSVIGFIMVGGELCTDQIWCENFTNKTLQSNNGGETFQARLHRHKY